MLTETFTTGITVITLLSLGLTCLRCLKAAIGTMPADLLSILTAQVCLQIHHILHEHLC